MILYDEKMMKKNILAKISKDLRMSMTKTMARQESNDENDNDQKVIKR